MSVTPVSAVRRQMSTEEKLADDCRSTQSGAYFEHYPVNRKVITEKIRA